MVDLGEPSYSMVLADDLDGDGKLDLLASGASGGVYALRTAARAHPLSVWREQVPGGNRFTAGCAALLPGAVLVCVGVGVCLCVLVGGCVGVGVCLCVLVGRCVGGVGVYLCVCDLWS